MSKLNLEIKLSDAVRLEKKFNEPLFSLLSNSTITNISDILMELGKSENEVEAAFKELGFEEIMFALMEDLQEAGFLPKSVKVDEMRGQLKTELSKALPKPSKS